LPVTLANLMDRVDREQYHRFSSELGLRLLRHPHQATDFVAIIHEIVRSGARRVGAHPG
jgi:hypothetical protein